jgi:hypothetical protein
MNPAKSSKLVLTHFTHGEGATTSSSLKAPTPLVNHSHRLDPRGYRPLTHLSSGDFSLTVLFRNLFGYDAKLD